uniref:HTH CENPB-type domain-containing protein n=1 Tax=Rhodnius prolixus TaxID=13249 RepID=T1HP36_RHOPR
MKAIVRDPAIEKKMEVALSLWIEDRIQKKGVPLSGPMVRVK